MRDLMELIILGSGTAALQAERGPSGYILKSGGACCLLDGGTGTLRQALHAGVSYGHIDYLFYTHYHPDHTVDLIPFLFATKHTPGFTRTKPLTISGPAGFHTFFNKLLDVYGRSIIEADYELEIFEFPETSRVLPAFKVESKLMKHSEGAVGYRFEHDGKVLVYSGDTDYCENIIVLARGADVLLIECSFADNNKVAGHLTPSEAGRIAEQAGVKRLFLTHIYPPFDEAELLKSARTQFSGPVEIARDLMRVTL